MEELKLFDPQMSQEDVLRQLATVLEMRPGQFVRIALSDGTLDENEAVVCNFDCAVGGVNVVWYRGEDLCTSMVSVFAIYTTILRRYLPNAGGIYE